MVNSKMENHLVGAKDFETLIRRDNYMYCEKYNFSMHYTAEQLQKLLRKYYPHLYSISNGAKMEK